MSPQLPEHLYCHDVPPLDYQAGFWFLYDRLCALRYAAGNPTRLPPETELDIIRDVSETAIDTLSVWLDRIHDGEHSYLSWGPCACGSEARV